MVERETALGLLFTVVRVCKNLTEKFHPHQGRQGVGELCNNVFFAAGGWGKGRAVDYPYPQPIKYIHEEDGGPL